MTARLGKPVGLELRPGSGEGEVTPSPVGTDALAALLRAQQAVTRNDAIRHLLDAVSAGLHAPEAMKALAEWDRTNASQRIETT